MKINKEKALNKFISLANDYIQELDKLKKKRGKPRKYSNEFYLRKILNVLVYGYTWSNLKYKGKFIGDTIRQRFYDWRNKKIFSKVATNLAYKYKRKVGKNVLKTLYIDSTTIINSNGTKCNYNKHKFRGKKSRNLTICCDDNRIIRSFRFDNSKLHDTTTALKVFKDKKLRNSTIIGDKGYILNEKKLIELKKKFGIKLITPFRSNMKKKNNKSDINKLKKRHKVENAFSHIKRGFKRLSTIMDRKQVNLDTWMLICNSILTLRFFYNTG